MKNSTAKVVRFAVVGAGTPNIATNHQIPGTVLAPHAHVELLQDIAPGVFDYAKRFQTRATQDFQAVLSDPAVDAVQIATPDQFHCQQAVAALDAGKAVVLQKPPCVSRKELDGLRAALDRHPGKLQILLNDRETPLVRTLRRALDDGMIGQLRAIMLRYRGRRFPVGNPRSFYLTAASGGVWMHNALHYLDEFYALSDRLPRITQCFATRNPNGAPELLGEGPNGFSCWFELDGIPALLEYNTMLLHDGLPGGIQRVLLGTKGELRVDYGETRIQHYLAGRDGMAVLPLLPRVYADASDDAVDSFGAAIEKISLNILNGKPGNGLAALAMTEALLAARESDQNNQIVEA
ncbi:MAG: Gfo/Idh/MocA family oxidoreductase [Victivallaceae bacterium]|nr:Gfo/Idh/MocA family oxidoreductase [Victivallaceae bacterium]